MISVVVTLCHLVTVGAGAKSFTGCFERTAAHVEINVNACGTLMPAVADWFSKTEYADGDEYWISSIRCVEGDYRANGDR
jgi:hypothetical protein